MRTRLALAAATVALLAPAASAQANTYCVSDPGCVSGGGTAEPDVQTALDTAAGNSGPDTVQLGPVTFTAPSASGFSYTASDPVNVVGAGAGATTIQDAAADSAVGLTVTGSPSSTVSQLGFAIPGGGQFERALTTTAALSHISITATASAPGALGVEFTGAGSISDSTLNLPEFPLNNGTATTGVAFCGPILNPSPPCPGGTGQSISDTTIIASTPILAEGTTGTAAHRVTLRGLVGVDADSATMTIDDSLVLVDPSSNGIGLLAFADPPEIQADNVTVVGSGSPGSIGVDAGAGDVLLRNSIVTGFDTAIERSTSNSVETDYSDYHGPVVVDGTPDTGSTTENNHLDVDPGFANPLAGNFALAPTSPLINAGDPAGPAAGDSLTDLAGNPRVAGGRLDIGAYEFQPPSSPPPPVTKDTTAPVFSGVSETNKVFAVGKAATPISAKRVKVGTTFRYKLSEPAKVKLVFAQKLPGRRVGKSCRKPSKRSHGKRCTRFVKKGTLTRTGSAGANSVKFSGRIGHRALKPGRYRVTITATDAAGNVSRAARLSFRVVKR